MKRNICHVLLAAALATAAFTTGCAVTSGRQGAGDYAQDRTITTRVKTALMGDPIVTGTQIDVTTFNNIVQLSGFVETQQEKERAGEIARLVDGVQSVQNDLVVGAARGSAPRD